MNERCSCCSPRALSRTMIMGLLVLWTEILWLAGPDRRFSGRLRLMKKERARLTAEIAETPASDPKRAAAASALSLLEEDLAEFEKRRADAFARAHEPLRRRLLGETTD